MKNVPSAWKFARAVLAAQKEKTTAPKPPSQDQ